MGKAQSTLAKNGYVVEKTETNPDPDMPFAATKGDEKILIKRISSKCKISTYAQLHSEREILNIRHPHIVNSKTEFPDEEHNCLYVVTDYFEGGSLADKIKERNETPQESEVLIWIAEICMALRTIHEKSLLQKALTPQDIHFTEFGILRLGGYQKVYENLRNTTAKANLTEISYLPPEVYLEGTYDVKSDIWSVGCILYELCTRQPAFSAQSTIKLMPKILKGPYPTLPKRFSQELCDILNNIFQKDPELRPTASDILEHPLIISHLIKKTTTSLEVVQTKVNALRALADGLERVHTGTTVGSLTGGVIGAVGGITSIVGLILSPFTLGASLIVTGVGVGVGTVGGVTAGAANITKMVNQSTDRKAVQNVIKEIEQKINAIATWLQEISKGLETFRIGRETPEGGRHETPEGGGLNRVNLFNLGTRAAKGLCGVTNLIKLGKVAKIGRIAAQAARAVRVAEVAAGVLFGLFVAVNIFFVAMDAKEIHNIRQAEAANEGTEPRIATNEDVPTFDDAKLLIGVPGPHTSQNQSPSDVKSELMKFVQAIRQAANNLQDVVDKFKSVIQIITSPEDERELDW